MAEEKKYQGYGYHGGGRPKIDNEARRATLSIVGTASEIKKIKELAKASEKTTSRFVIEEILHK